MIGFPSGAIAHAHLSWLAPTKLRTMTVIGSKKMVLYDDVQTVEKVKIYDQGVEKLSGEELRRSYRAGDIHSPRIPVTEALQIEMRHFIECVRDGKKPRSGRSAPAALVWPTDRTPSGHDEVGGLCPPSPGLRPQSPRRPSDRDRR